MPGYLDAVRSLNTLQTNYSVIAALHKQWQQYRTRRTPELIPEMLEFLRRVGYTPQDLNQLNALHVTGTKGKGSTCAFTQSILMQYVNQHERLSKVGLYTSPHLIHVRERLMINGSPLSEEKFAQYFFEVSDRLEQTNSDLDKFPHLGSGVKPMYFKYLTLMSFHAFMKENVDAAIYEVGIGGEYDSTNVFSKAKACAVTSLGLDHVNVLGNTIEEIAWNKAGIFKPDCPAYTVNTQPVSALQVLEQRASEKRASDFRVVDVHPQVAETALGLHGKFQQLNATLACYLAAERLGIALSKHNDLPREFVTGLQQASWPGRCQRVETPRACWYLDGAHTVESLEVATDWFARTADPTQPTTLVFNQQKRDNVADLLKGLHEALDQAGVKVRRALFTTNKSTRAGYEPDMVSHNVSQEHVDELVVQKQLARVWRQLDPRCDVAVCDNLADVVDQVRGQVFATGSLLMVGGLLSAIGQ